MKTVFLSTALAVFILSGNVCRAAEDSRAQYPPWLSNSYIGFNIGYVKQTFTHVQLERGYQASTIENPKLMVSVTLFGHHFNKNFSAQLTYKRPVHWVRYKNINGITSEHTVRTNLASITGRATAPIGSLFSIYAEGGLGIVTRSGFNLENRNIVKDANYPTMLLGTGLQYRLSDSLDLQTSIAYAPPNKSFMQPHTFLVSSGIVFNMRPLSAEKVKNIAQLGVIFPKNLVQIGYATNTFGTGVNRFVSRAKIFWGGSHEVTHGVTLRYQRNVFHTKKIFSLDLGVSAANWRGAKNQISFYTFSLFPQFRFTLIRLKQIDLYLGYSLAGPTYITKTITDGRDIGQRFTFQDLLGLGWYMGKQRHINMEVGIGHFSNGNIFPQNPSVKVPLTFTVGYTF
ncbi:MAG: acyloxyacyl hydrolase [Candidatus Yanofskybacteria bacterium]|nr:acyloxyacyl hydrolase [Candidatus Yanofskybacteria bacterium]